MAWSGVPFANAAAWSGYAWWETDFWNQFVDQSDIRRDALTLDDASPGYLDQFADGGSMVGIGTGAFDANSLNKARESEGGYWTNSGTRWVDSDLLTEGELLTDAYLFDNSTGYATQALVDKINGLLTAASLPNMGSTLLTSGTGTRIPWTRKYGTIASPTTAYGKAEAGDIVGPWLFNEWYYFLQALDTVAIIDTDFGSSPDADYDAETKDSGIQTDSVCETARIAAISAHGLAGTGSDTIRPYKVAIHQWVPAFSEHRWTVYTSTGDRVYYGLGDLTNLDAVIRFVVMEDPDSGTFSDMDSLGVNENEIYDPTTDATPAAGDYTTPTYLDHDSTFATVPGCAESSDSLGYGMRIQVAAMFDFPTP